MITLYEMSKEWQDVFEMLLDPEIPEEAVFDTIEMIEADMDTKADSYAKIIKSMDGDTAQIDTEIKRLQERKTSINNRQKALKQRLFDTMKATGGRNSRRRYSLSIFRKTAVLSLWSCWTRFRRHGSSLERLILPKSGSI